MGQTASFEPLVVKYQPRVFAIARRYARRENEVEDIANGIPQGLQQALKL